MQISTTSSDFGPGPEVTIDGQGTATVVWIENSTAQSARVFAARSTGDGGWSPPALLHAAAGQLPWHHVVSNARGDTLAAWNIPGSVLAARFVDGGWSAPEIALASNANTFRLAEAGNGVILYASFVSGSGTVPFIARRDEATGMWRPPVQVTSAPGSLLANGYAFDDGLYLASWSNGTPNARRVEGREYFPDGGVGPVTPYDTSRPTGNPSGIVIGPSSSGSALVAWEEFGGGYGVYAGRYVRTGSFSTLGRISLVTTQNPPIVSVASDVRGNGWVGWTTDNTNPTYSGFVSFFRNGAGFGAPIALLPFPGELDSYGTVVLDDDGQGAAYWRGATRISGVRLAPDGTAGSTRQMLTTSQTVFQIDAAAHAGRIVLVWSQEPTSPGPRTVWGSWCQ